MKKVLSILILFLLSITLGADTEVIQQKDFENKTVSVDLDGYKILKFTKSIKKIHFDNSSIIEADFLKDDDQPLTTLKIKGKKVGKQNALVTFYDSSIATIKFNVVKNINDVIHLVSTLFPNIQVSQINDTIVLQGHVKNQTQKSTLIDIFKKYGIDTDAKIIDLIKDNYSTKMVRVKVYVVQIDNNAGQQIINEWQVDGVSGSDLFGDAQIDSITVDPNITSLAGGITALASYGGPNFDIGLTLNYLKKNNAARIVNESTLVMKENQEAKFNTGGKFFIKSSTTTAEGVPSTELKEIEYGLNITMKAKKIIENEYIDFEAMAKSDDIDDNNVVDDIPGLIGNEVTTNVLIENGSTIVLAGILKSDYSEYKEKIPGLGDLPILGFLFRSVDTRDENTDLVFFMTPEIIDPMNNDETKTLEEKLNVVRNRDYTKQENTIHKPEEEMKGNDTKSDKKEKDSNSNNTKSENVSEPKLTDEERHQQMVNEVLGYN